MYISDSLGAYSQRARMDTTVIILHISMVSGGMFGTEDLLVALWINSMDF